MTAVIYTRGDLSDMRDRLKEIAPILGGYFCRGGFLALLYSIYMAVKDILRKTRRSFDVAVAGSRARTARRSLKSVDTEDYFAEPTPPYYSQFASANLVSDILAKKILATDDPRWRSFGFKESEEYEFWSWRLCGLICMKMVLDAYGVAKGETIESLTRKGVALGGYNKRKDVGWFSAPLVKLAKSFGLNGKVYRVLSVETIAGDVLSGGFVVASVNPNVIRGDKVSVPEDERGGHLVLVWGVKVRKGEIVGFYIHNPSGRKKSSQEKAYVPIEQFHSAFGGRGFLIRAK